MDDLNQIRFGARIANMQPYLDAELQREIELVIAKTMTAISQKTLTADAAMYAWMEIHAIKGLQKRLNKAIQLGQSAGERLKPALDEAS